METEKTAPSSREQRAWDIIRNLTFAEAIVLGLLQPTSDGLANTPLGEVWLEFARYLNSGGLIH